MKYKIREIRKAQKMTQAELAQKSGVTRATICALERKKNRVTTSKTLSSIAKALDVLVDQLIEDEE